MSDVSDDWPVVRVWPEPTEEEAVAIAAALQVLRGQEAPAAAAMPRQSRWIAAARREAMQGLGGDEMRWTYAPTDSA